MRRILLALAVTFSVSLTALAQQIAADAPETRAQAVLKQARAAIWDETKSKPLQSLSINATSRRVQGQGEATTEMTLDVLLPDKFLQTNVRFFGMAEFTSLLAVNGTQTWSDFKQPSAGLDIGSAKAAMGGGSATKGDSEGAAKKADLRGGGPSGIVPRGNQADLGRMLLAWLLITPATLPVEFTYAGQATAQANGQTADVLEVKGPNKFAARLFLDQQTHQMLMLTYQIRMPSLDRGSPAPGQGTRPPEGKRDTAGNQGNRTPADNRQAPPLTPEEMERRGEAAANAPEVEVRWVVSDYRHINGLTLPHRLTKSTGGQVTEEIEIQKVKVNPSLKPSKFQQPR